MNTLNIFPILNFQFPINYQIAFRNFAATGQWQMANLWSVATGNWQIAVLKGSA